MEYYETISRNIMRPSVENYMYLNSSPGQTFPIKNDFNSSLTKSGIYCLSVLNDFSESSCFGASRQGFQQKAFLQSCRLWS